MININCGDIIKSIRSFIFSENITPKTKTAHILEILVFSVSANAFLPTVIEPVLKDNYNSSILFNLPAPLETISQFTSDFRLIYLYQAAVLFLLYIFIKLINVYFPSILENKILSNLLMFLLLTNLFAMYIIAYSIVTNYQPLSNEFIYGILSFSQQINYYTPIYCIRLILIFSPFYAIYKRKDLINALKNLINTFINILGVLKKTIYCIINKLQNANQKVILIIVIGILLIGIVAISSCFNNHLSEGIPETTKTTSYISVSSSPSAASIYLDGTYQGRTPKILNSTEQSSHIVTLKLKGYEDWSQAISVSASKTVTISPTLIPALTPIDSSTPSADSAETITEINWSGKWTTNWGLMELRQSGSNVEGNYSYDQEGYGNIQGYIKGVVYGDKLVGTWYQAPSYSPPDYAGDMEFTIINDSKSFSGKWRFGSEGEWYESWGGTRISV